MTQLYINTFTNTKTFQTTNQQRIKRPRCDSVNLQLIPRGRVGKVRENYYWKQKIREKV
jgi:hypothetical protein